MADIILKVDFYLVTLDDLVGLEEGDQSAKFVRSIISRFMIDPATNDYYPPDLAIKKAGALNLYDSEKAVQMFAAQVKELKEAKIPPTNGGN